MKLKLIQQIFTMARYMFYGLIIQVFLSSFLTPTDSHGQKESIYKINIDLNAKGKDLSEILNEIEQKTKFEFSYFRSNQIPFKINKPETDKYYKDVKLSTILGDLSLAYGLQFRRVNNRIAVRKSKSKIKEVEEIFDIPTYQAIITGRVVSEDQEPLPGLSIIIKGTTTGTTTDLDGNYSLAANEGDILQFSFIGYQTQEIEILNQSTINVTMLPDLEQLEEVVIVGYGTQKKSDITGSLVSFDTKAIEEVPATNISQVLQGRLAGVTISQNGGTAEGNSNIQIRGQNSLTASNSPLIILDGIPFSGGLSSINPNDIESLEVLKDASSAAIYGARAANGVILITTKKGEAGKPRISYSGNYSVSEVINEPDLMDPTTFYNRKIDFFTNDNAGVQPDLSAIFTPTELENFAAGNFTDWDDLATQTGKRQEHNISVSGGTDNLSYFISGSIVDSEGVSVNDKFARYNVRFNIDAKITNWLTFGTNTLLGYVDRSGEDVEFNYDFGNAYTLRLNPLTRAFDDNGALNLVPWPENVPFRNPLERERFINEDFTTSINSNNYFQIDLPIDGLSYRMNTGYTNRSRTIQDYRGRNTIDGLEDGGNAEIVEDHREEWVVENIVNYQKDFGKHSIFLTGLYSAQKNTRKRRETDGAGFPSDIRSFYQIGSAELITVQDLFEESSFVSQMFRANYGFDGRYNVTFTVRRDGFSGFGNDNKFGVFPSLGLGWNITNEPFLGSQEIFDNLKLRFTVGENGNQAIGPYSTLAPLSSRDYLDANQNTAIGFFPQALGDPSLGWETSRTFNYGLDFGVLNNRIQGSLDFYATKTTDLLLNRRISPLNGTSSIRQNIGETETNGFDLQITSINYDKEDFRWSTDFNFSIVRTKIVDVGLRDSVGNAIDDVANSWFIGEPQNVFFQFEYGGVWQLDDNIAESAQPDALPGDVRVVDANGDGVINQDDRVIVGNQQPNFIAGMNNTFSYKNFTLSVFIHTVQGVTRGNPLWTTFFNNYDGNIYNYNFWTPDNPTNDFPANRSGVDPIGSKPRGDGSFTRLKNVTLAYRFNQDLISKYNLSNLEVFVTGTNLATFTNYEFGWDPEFAPSPGFDPNRATPLNRTFLVGLRVSL